jgi:hypothetical protein
MTEMKYYPGDIIKWYPKESDYPSIVELIKPLGPDDGYPKGSWRVQYFDRDEDDTEWVIPASEMSVKVFDISRTSL